ncbi:hypothetical protein HYPSUDRAFT_209633 [Hypholoma sublateritium FD-334 SS-4]|uniref:Uncharacterized protein n=1 Tax=Hypholoma sublateritium (strain FD-334 SS-4) TaxID=945553 RepID=A0A0D2NXX4_HYPSF|nr:hypothetical protein HYPSUDRAFT_209633 [Hypholoma sublateritium FD-334 SS-4]
MFRLLCVLAAALVCAAQTILTTDSNGNPITTTIGVPAATTAASATTTPAVTTTTPLTTTTTPVSTTTTPATTTTTPATIAPQPTVQQGGPVGQPASTTITPGAPISYVYTTVIGGVTSVVADVFTPTSPSTIEVLPTGTGTILDFSAYQSIYGTLTAPATRPIVPIMYTLSAVVAIWTVLA